MSSSLPSHISHVGPFCLSICFSCPYSLLHEVNAADETNEGVESDFEVSGGNLGLFVPVGHFGGCGAVVMIRSDLTFGLDLCMPTLSATHNLLRLNKTGISGGEGVYVS